MSDDFTNRVFTDVDATVRATFQGIGARYLDKPAEGNFAVCALVPVLCACIEEIARTVDPSLRQAWA